MNKIRIVIVEDHDLTRMGLKAALQQQPQISVVGEAANGQQGLALLQRVQPDVAVVDIGLPDIDGIEVTRQFKAASATEESLESPTTRILMLTMHDTEEAVMAAFAAGADSYSVKDVDVDKLVEAIQLTHDGQVWIDPAIARIVLTQAKRIAPPATVDLGSGDDYAQVLEMSPLTERELEVLELIVAGSSNAQIAEQLYITVGTVKTHVCNILNKLSASDRTQAAVRALRTGLVQ